MGIWSFGYEPPIGTFGAFGAFGAFGTSGPLIQPALRPVRQTLDERRGELGARTLPGRPRTLHRVPDLPTPWSRQLTAVTHHLLKRGGGGSSRVLVLQPQTPTLGVALHEDDHDHILQDVCALIADHSSLTTELDEGFDTLVVSDWLSDWQSDWQSDWRSETAAEQRPGDEAINDFRSPQPGRSFQPDILPSVIRQLGQFDVVIAHELSRFVPFDRIPHVLAWLSAMVKPFGYVLSSEPFEVVAALKGPERMAAPLALEGLQLTYDTDYLHDMWMWPLLRWQKRPADESRLVGVLTPVALATLQADPHLEDAVITAYREVFGGDEWGEWMQCTQCERHYSRRQFIALSPPGTCVCGVPDSLVPYYTLADVRANLQRELADDTASRCYVRTGPSGAVEAFIWGYHTNVLSLAHTLLPTETELARSHLGRELVTLLEAEGASASAPVYYQSEVGSVVDVRSLSLIRGLLQRMCHFAEAKDVRLFITRTARGTNAFSLCLGIGMEVVYDYSLDHPQDRRVILAVGVQHVLNILDGMSDRRLALLIARALKGQSA